MPKFLIEAAYTPEGTKGVQSAEEVDAAAKCSIDYRPPGA